ncbi:MAG: acyl-CoA dehydrogenase [Planctomycetes bacterium]|nr:acyl-CoA dehydrogenase [Planctomycetota bacterium]
MIAELTKRVREFGPRAANLVEGLDEDRAARRALDLLAEADLLGWTVPQRHGGAAKGDLVTESEVSVRALCALRDELAWHSGMLDVMFVMQGLGSYPLVLGGSAELCGAILPDVVRGKQVAAFAVTEAGAGSSLGEANLRAEQSDGRWRLNGAKTFISNAGLAGFYSVLARTSGEPGDGGRDSLTMFFVPATTKGLEVRRFEVMAPHPIGEVILNDVDIADTYRLGEVGSGLKIALGTLNRFRTSVAAAANGFSRRALDESVKHLEDRNQFGKPLSAFQGLRFDLAEMDARLRASQLLTEEAANALDRGEEAVAEVARAKLTATETASWICDRAVQHHGGLGVKRGVIVERLFREVRALRIYEGTSEVQKLILAKDVLERARKRSD